MSTITSKNGVAMTPWEKDEIFKLVREQTQINKLLFVMCLVILISLGAVLCWQSLKIAVLEQRLEQLPICKEKL